MSLRCRALCALALMALGCGPRTERVVMRAENNSGQSGFATLTALSRSSTRIELDIAASNDPSPQVAHVHEGQCGEIGVIRAGLSSLAASPRDASRFVSVSENVTLGLDQLLTGEFAINVHDARDRSLYVSCGNLGP